VSGIVSLTVDSDGRHVRLTARNWDHIKEAHPELSPHLREIMAALRDPAHRFNGPKPGEEWFLSDTFGPGNWLRVVVHYEGGEGWIATAHLQARLR
jgi:hypothetical protein